MTSSDCTFEVNYSPEDGEYVGTVREFEFLSHLAPSPERALKGIRNLVSDVVGDMREAGEAVPGKYRGPHTSAGVIIDPEAQAEYDNSPELRELLSRAAVEPTIHRRREYRTR